MKKNQKLKLQQLTEDQLLDLATDPSNAKLAHKANQEISKRHSSSKLQGKIKLLTGMTSHKHQRQLLRLLIGLVEYENKYRVKVGLPEDVHTKAEIWGVIEDFYEDCWLYVLDDCVVGCVMFCGDSLCGFYVREDLRGSGIGSALYDKITQQRDIKQLTVVPGSPAIKFYEKRGFYFIDDYVMVLPETKGDK